MTLKKFTWLALWLPLVVCGAARADEDKSAPADDAASTAADKDKSTTAAQPADASKPAEEVKPATPAAKPVPPLLPRLRGQAPPAGRRPAADAVRAGLGAALRAAGELQNADRPPPEDGEPGDRRPPPPPRAAGRDYAPPGGFAGDEDNPPPPDGGAPPPPPPPPRPGEDGPPPPGQRPKPQQPRGGLAAPAGNGGLGPVPVAAPRAAQAPGDNPFIAPRPGAGGLLRSAPGRASTAGIGGGLGGPRAGGELAPLAAAPRFEFGGPDDPEMQQLNQREAHLENQSRDLSHQYRGLPDGKRRDELRAELADVVTKHFEIRQQRRQLELERLEKQLDRLRGAIDKRTAERDALIKHRTEQLLGEEQDSGF